MVTVYNWLAKHPEFLTMYTRAREDQADTLADQIIEIADGTDLPDQKRVRIDARKWISMKLKPRQYGDKQQVDVSVTKKLEDMTDDELANIARRGSEGTAAPPPDKRTIN